MLIKTFLIIILDVLLVSYWQVALMLLLMFIACSWFAAKTF